MAAGVPLKVLSQQILFYLLVAAVICMIIYYSDLLDGLSMPNNCFIPKPKKTAVQVIKSNEEPWKNVPEFILYIRLTSGKRWEREYRNVFLRTLKIFFPIEQSKLLIVLDGDKKEDHILGSRLKNEWPYPEICFRNRGDPAIFNYRGKTRMYFDMMYPDSCTKAPYVGYVDTDTFFSTLVTPDLLFEESKPVIIAKIGLPPHPCWEALTEIFIGRKEVMQCMSVFPLMFKTSHIKEMREVLAKEQGKHFDLHFRDALTAGGGESCMCQFSIICNYVWYHHRDAYAWHLQMVPDGKWTGQDWVPSMVPVDYYTTVVQPEERIPKPRGAIHLRYTITNGVGLLGKLPESHFVEDFIKEGLCYSGGFNRCPKKCKKWNKNALHFNLYAFEYDQWFWDERCLAEQEKHYRKVEAFLDYYDKNKKAIFGLRSINELCSLL